MTSKAKRGATIRQTSTPESAKALVLAINSNKPADLAALLATGCDVDAPVSGHTLLFRAVLQARPEMVELLLQHGADWRVRDQITRWTPLTMATINVHRSARRHFTARAIKDSKRVIQALEAAGARDPETSRVLGNCTDEATLATRAAARHTRADEAVMELDGALVIVPPRMCRGASSRFDTIENYARQRGLTRLLRALVKNR